MSSVDPFKAPADPADFYNFTNPDNSGILRFLIDELEASEMINQRVFPVHQGLTAGLDNRACVERIQWH